MSSSPQDLLASAFRDHQAGLLAAAEAGYAGILERWPETFDALHMLGIVALQTGRPVRAVLLVAQAIRLRRLQIAYDNLKAELDGLAARRRRDEAALVVDPVAADPEFEEAGRQAIACLYTLNPTTEHETFGHITHGIAEAFGLAFLCRHLRKIDVRHGGLTIHYRLARIIDDEAAEKVTLHRHTVRPPVLYQYLHAFPVEENPSVAFQPFAVVRRARIERYVAGGDAVNLFTDGDGNLVCPEPIWIRRYQSPSPIYPYISADLKFTFFGLVKVDAVYFPHRVVYIPSRPNYGHFLLDTLPYVAVLDEAPELAALPVVTDIEGAYQEELVQALRPQGVVRVPRHTTMIVEADEALVPWPVAYPLRIELVRRAVLERLAERLAAVPPGPERIFISRRDAAKVRLLNEDAILAALEPLGFVAIRPEELPVVEQIALFSRARVIVGAHGAGLSNLVFAPRTAALVEIVCEEFLTDRAEAGFAGFFQKIAATIGQTHLFVGGPADDAPEVRATDRKFRCDPDRVRRAVELVLSLQG